MTIYRVYSQSWASGDIFDIENFEDSSIAQIEYESRKKNDPTHYHAFLKLIEEQEATAYFMNGKLVRK